MVFGSTEFEKVCSPHGNSKACLRHHHMDWSSVRVSPWRWSASVFIASRYCVLYAMVWINSLIRVLF